MQPIQRKTGMQRTLVQQYFEVDVEKSEVGLWADISQVPPPTCFWKNKWVGEPGWIDKNKAIH